MSDDLPPFDCNICRRVRPFDIISVMPFFLNRPDIAPEYQICLNVRYCNDTPECIAAVEEYGARKQLGSAEIVRGHA